MNGADPTFDVRGRGRGKATAARAFAFIGLTLLFLVVLNEKAHIEEDPQFCAATCHLPTAVVSDWHAGGHQELACQACHTTRAAESLGLFWQSLVGASATEKHGAVASETCDTCHRSGPGDFRLLAATGGHRDHDGAAGVSCLSCHGGEAHAGQPSETSCRACHADERLHEAATSDAESCTSCHPFGGSTKGSHAPTAVACVTCHGSPERTNSASTAGSPVMKLVDAHVLHGDVGCELCHNPHGKKPRAPEGEPVCAACHRIEVFHAGTEAKAPIEGHRDCERCHAPHAPTEVAEQSCLACHAKNASARPDGSSSTALEHESCTSCHLPHSWRAERAGCVTCHGAQTQDILTRSPPAHGTCTNCHEVHGPPPTGAVCVNCHADTKKNHLTLAPERHRDCTSCHQPHAPSPRETRASCAKCHEQQLATVVRDGPEGHLEKGCIGCHEPHNDPATRATTCNGCHAREAKWVTEAEPTTHQTCTSCHAPHTFKIERPAKACGTCHGAAAAARPATAVAAFIVDPAGAHRGTCTDCHLPHGSPRVSSEACRGCHQGALVDFNAPNAKHARCGSCHEPHKPVQSAQDRCGSCHAPMASVASQWPPTSPHATSCGACHQPHDVTKKKACADCHGAEATSALTGKHRCEQCHAPHQAPPGTGPAWWSRCAACHEKEVNFASERGPTHERCENCHKLHAFAVPECTSCHPDANTHGLHRVKEHTADCSQCHDAHDKQPPTREDCLSCHKDRRAHEPQATTCFGCHPFQ